MMMPLKEMFYGEKESVWVVKPPEKKKDEQAATKPGPPTALEEAFGTFFPYYHPPYAAPPGPEKKPAAERNVELWVDICCLSPCVENLTIKLKELKGIKSVNCDIENEKVTVKAATETTTEDILLQCRQEFRNAKLWSAV